MALIVAMVVMLLFLGVTGAIIPLAVTETTVGANHRRAAQGLYAAEAALEWVLDELGDVSDWNAVLRGRLASGLWSSTVHVRLPSGDALDLGQVTDELNDEGWGPIDRQMQMSWRLFAHGAFDRLVSPSTPLSFLHVAVWVSDDPAEMDTDPTTDSNGILQVRATAFGPARARRSVAATVRRLPGGEMEVESRQVGR